MSYVRARIEEYSIQSGYRAQDVTCYAYISEGIRAITENTSVLGGIKLNCSLHDVLTHDFSKTEVRTGEEIIEHIKNKLHEFGR